MNPRTLYSGWSVAIALLGAIVVAVGPPRIGIQENAPASVSPHDRAGPVAVAGPARDDAFLHEDHDGLFPLCTGCHIGAETGVVADLYPPVESCATCHDGVTEERIEWAGPGPRETNLLFDHGDHLLLVEDEGDDPLDCVSCHGDPAPLRLATPRVEAAECLTCHEDADDDVGHFVDADCTQCHVSAATSTLGVERIAGFPTPADHAVDEEEAFLTSVHADAAAERLDSRCATCHVQDQCADCHVNASRVEEIRALPAQPAGRPFPALEARYPVPESHTAARFAWQHTGIAEADGANCATCHTAQSCLTCHIEPVPTPIDGLVHHDTVTAPGAVVEAAAPESHDSFFFMQRHGTLAATEESSCATCHEPESFCASCHERQADGGATYHTPNYSLGHAAEAANSTTECATCHDPVAFCRACHTEVGFQTSGRLGPGYHDAEPLWLLRHPQAARQQLEGCTSCHTQRDCLQCHSQLGAFQISPHGPDFDARAAYARNPVVCRACHLGDPFGGGGR